MLGLSGYSNDCCSPYKCMRSMILMPLFHYCLHVLLLRFGVYTRLDRRIHRVSTEQAPLTLFAAGHHCAHPFNLTCPGHQWHVCCDSTKSRATSRAWTSLPLLLPRFESRRTQHINTVRLSPLHCRYAVVCESMGLSTLLPMSSLEIYGIIFN